MRAGGCPQGEGRATPLRDEAILVVRAPPRSERAESCLARRGLADAPVARRIARQAPQRPALSGYLQQETYVRIYIPCSPREYDNSKEPGA